MAQTGRGGEAMATIALVGGEVATPSGELRRGTVVVRGSTIATIDPEGGCPPEAEAIDARGRVVSPGFIDVHIHGAAGHDIMDATPEALAAISGFAAQHGVTGFLPTTVTAGLEATWAAIGAVDELQRAGAPGAAALGVHLEGPYISGERMGAQNPAHVRGAEPSEYVRLFELGNIRLISLAPEMPGIERLVRFAVARGAAVAVGHSSATYDQVLAAVGWGLSQATHTYNAMREMHHREPGATGAVLTCDAIYAQVIVDLVHVHPAMVKLLVRAKGPDRAVLVTDAMRAAGMPDGRYDLGGQETIVKGGEARLPAGNLAGSTLTMERAVRNVMGAAELTLPQALRLATRNPAASIGLGGRKGQLAPGYDADIVLLDADLRVALTMVGGRVVYRA